jgi:hypothetical protein
MTKGKIIALILFLIIFTVTGTVVIRKMIDNNIRKLEVKRSKRIIYSETKKYFNMLDYRHLEMRDNEKMNNIEGIKNSANEIIEKINEIEEEIDNADWCKTRNLNYNTDCNLYKEVLKEEIEKTEKYIVLKLETIENSGDKVTEEKMQSALKRVTEEHEEFHKKRDEFLEKNYNKK